MTVQRLEIRPSVRKNTRLMSLGCAAFVIAGIWMLFGSNPVGTRVWGVLAILFFGFPLFNVVPRMRRRVVTMVLTPDAMEQVFPEGTASIPWSDVEQVGVFSVKGPAFVGIRLKSYKPYLDSMPSQLTAYMLKVNRFVRIMAGATAVTSVMTDMSSLANIQSELSDIGDQKTLASFTECQNLVKMMLWQRKRYGYDIALGWADRDRPAPAFATLLQSYLPSR
jgi:Protein of unknown function (DUF2982)